MGGLPSRTGPCHFGDTMMACVAGSRSGAIDPSVISDGLHESSIGSGKAPTLPKIAMTALLDATPCSFAP